MKRTNKVLLKLAAIILCLCSFATISLAAAGTNNLTPSQKSFIDKVGALATADMKKSGVLASLTMAQAILESGWGASALTANANALFGIKADSRWSGRVYSIGTQECYDGTHFVNEVALFRAYDSWEHSVSDHSAFLRANSRYAAVVGEKDYKKVCTAIHKAGYATDPGYADKLIKLIESYGLMSYDTGSATEATTEPVTEAPAAPVTDPPTEPATEPATEAPAEPTMESAAEVPSESAAASLREPAPEAPAEPATAPPPAPAAEAPSEVPSEAATEAAAKPSTEPAKNPATKASAKPAVEATEEPDEMESAEEAEIITPAEIAMRAAAEPAMEPIMETAAKNVRNKEAIMIFIALASLAVVFIVIRLKKAGKIKEGV